jgi:predicted transcriptional regulator
MSMNRSRQATDVAASAAETSEERDVRIRYEAGVIAQGEADIAAGLGVDDETFEAWLDALEKDEGALLPVAKSPSPRR